MSDQPASSNNNNNNNNNNRPSGTNNASSNSRRYHNQNNQNKERTKPDNSNNGPRPSNQPGQSAQHNKNGQNPQQGQVRDGDGGQRRRPNRNHNNRPRNPNQRPNPNQNNNTSLGMNIERIYEKYLNLLDQHLIARRKYHDLFYRADLGQKNKLEKNFYNTINDIREFESRLAPEARELFEKRNNGLSLDTIYTSNHEIPVIGDNPPPPTEWQDPHFLHSQESANFKEDREESMGSLDDYLKYKNLI